jgi:hypothetical protein
MHTHRTLCVQLADVCPFALDGDAGRNKCVLRQVQYIFDTMTTFIPSFKCRYSRLSLHVYNNICHDEVHYRQIVERMQTAFNRLSQLVTETAASFLALSTQVSGFR